MLSPKYASLKFIDFPEGCDFGVIDILGSIMALEDVDHESALENWILYKDKLKRQFTVQTQSECELLSLTIQDLMNMRTEFLEAYEALLSNSFVRLDRAMRLKMHAQRYCERHMFKNSKCIAGKVEDASSDYMKKQVGFRRSFTRGYNTKKIVNKHFKFTPVDLREVDDQNVYIGDSQSESDSEASSEFSCSGHDSSDNDASSDSEKNARKSEAKSAKEKRKLVKKRSIFARDEEEVLKSFKIIRNDESSCGISSGDDSDCSAHRDYANIKQ